ncbi:unnamed protein product [Leuciscus chuanchicus]
MDREFSCPCSPGFNMILISIIFLAPALLALAVMMFIQRPCRQSSSHCAGLFLLCLIPSSLWMFLLLFEGEYVACGMVHWEGDYVLDEELQIKWCKPTGVNATDLLELTEKLIFYSRFSALVLLASLSVVVIAAVSCWDCRARCLEYQEKRDKLKQLSELSVVYAPEHSPVLTPAPEHRIQNTEHWLPELPAPTWLLMSPWRLPSLPVPPWSHDWLVLASIMISQRDNIPLKNQSELTFSV